MPFSVFIADDDVFWCEELYNHLSKNSLFNVNEPVHDGKTAIEYIKEYRPQIIVLDLLLPQCDGINVIYNIKQLPYYNPFIYVITVLKTNNVQSMIHDLNIDYYSVKPSTVKAVEENLTIFLDRNLLIDKTAKDDTIRMQMEINIHKQINDYLYDLGLRMNTVSARCLSHVLMEYLLCDGKINNKDIYQKVGLDLDKNAAAIEKNVRLAVAKIISLSNPYFISKFPDTTKLKNNDFLGESIYIIRQRIEEVLND